MSGFLTGLVWNSDLPRQLKPLAAALADIANDDGTSIFPTIGYVAWKLSASKRSVASGLAELRDLGVLAVVAQGGGSGRSTEYRMIEKALPARPAWSARARRKNAAESASFQKPCNLPQETMQNAASETMQNAALPSLLTTKIDPSGDPPAFQLSQKALTPEDLQAIWNEHRGKLSECRILSSERKQQARARIKEQPSREIWIRVAQAIASDAWCTGSNPSGWMAEIDHMLKDSTWVRVVEGNYDRRAERDRQKRPAGDARQQTRRANVPHVAAQGIYIPPDDDDGEDAPPKELHH